MKKREPYFWYIKIESYFRVAFINYVINALQSLGARPAQTRFSRRFCPPGSVIFRKRIICQFPKLERTTPIAHIYGHAAVARGKTRDRYRRASTFEMRGSDFPKRLDLATVRALIFAECLFDLRICRVDFRKFTCACYDRPRKSMLDRAVCFWLYKLGSIQLFYYLNTASRWISSKNHM